VGAVDYIEASRTAYQLSLDHGRNAYLYAEKLAREAKAEGKLEEAQFWDAVAGVIRPR
jgi:hypothetical protein